MSMNADIKAQWTAALRSGEYVQGQNYLNIDGKLCCLGVLCELAVKAEVISMDEGFGIVFYDGKNDVLPTPVREWAGLPEDGESNPNNPHVSMGEDRVSLAELNDGENGYEPHTFGQIADIIDAQL